MKTFFTCLLCCICINLFSQTTTFSLKGNLNALPGSTIVLSNAAHFKENIKVDNWQTFKATIKGDKGYYFLQGYGLLYLSPGMSLTFSRQSKAILVTGKGSVENEIIKSIQKLEKENFPVQEGRPGSYLNSIFNTMEPAEFLKYTEGFKSSALALLNREDIDSYFKATQTEDINYMIKYYTNSYKSRYGIDSDKEAEYLKAISAIKAPISASEMMTNIRPLAEAMRVKRLSQEDKMKIDVMVWENFDLNNSELFAFSIPFKALLTLRIETLVRAELTKSPYRSSPAEQTYLKMEVIAKEFAEGIIREYFLYTTAITNIKRGINTEQIYKKYIELAKDPVYLAEINSLNDNLKLTGAGALSPQFEFEDINKKNISLSSLKGNYVFIDVWATWCAPCVKEIPFLKTLEQKYDGKPIKFVSISVDRLGDKSKWKKYVVENNLKGIQLFADKDFKSDFIKAYGINAIPRFIIIDPEGKIVSPNAIRPSNPKINATIDELLTKI